MKNHRNPQDSVSNDLPPHNPERFSPSDAIESFHGDVLQLEALSHALYEAVVCLPFPPDRDRRRLFERVYALASQVENEACNALERGNERLAALQAHLQSGSRCPEFRGLGDSAASAHLDQPRPGTRQRDGEA